MPDQPARKPRNATKTRAAILAAAFELFAGQGYARTGTREIALQAGVSSSLIARYFGNKATLFEEALVHGIYNNSLFVYDREHFGEQMARLVASDSNPQLTAMTVLAIADPESREIARRVTRQHVIEPLARWIGPPQATARALNMLALLHGFIIQTRHLSSDAIPAASIHWLARALQDILDNPPRG